MSKVIPITRSSMPQLAGDVAARIVAGEVVDDHDDAWWEERDAKVAALGAAEARAAALARLRVRAAKMITAGWPVVQTDAALELEGDVERSPLVRRVERFEPAGAVAERTILVLSSGVGSGKTTAACRWALTSGGASPAFLRAATFARTSRYDNDARKRWERASSLVLDDLGAEYVDGKGSFLVDLDELLDMFYAARRPVIITTNLEAAAFKARYGGEAADASRIMSRLRGAGRWYSSKEPDRRKA